MKKILFVLFFPVFLFVSNCKIGDDTSQIVRDVYSFQEEYKLSNVKKEYNVGDLIWMEYNRSNDAMTDVTTGQEIVVPNPTLFTNLLLFDPFTEPNNIEKFGSVFQEGVFEDTNDFSQTGELRIEFGCPHNPVPQLKLGIELKAPGGYLLYPNPNDPFVQFAFTDQADCSSIALPNIPDDADFGFVEFVFDVEDANLDKFDEYASLNGDPEFDIQQARNLLQEKKVFFILVN